MFISKKILYFMMVARETSFRAAAEKLCLSITPVNKGVHDLENYVGYKLFYRTNDGVKLTPLGLSLFNRLEPIISDLKSIQEVSKDKRREKITIAVGGFYFYEIYDVVIDVYKENKTIINLINECEDNVSSMIFKNEVDLFILNSTSNECNVHNDIIVKNLRGDELKFAVSEKVINSYKDSKEILEKHPLTQLSKTVTPLCYGSILNHMKENNISTPIFKMASIDQVLSLVSSGEAVSFFPSSINKIKNWDGYGIKLINSPIGQIPLYRKAYFRQKDNKLLHKIIDKLKDS